MERIIRKRLAANPALIEIVGDRIFYHKASQDTAQVINYPHIILGKELYSDALNGVAGLLTVDIICAEENKAPEEIELLVRQTLTNVFFKGEEIFLLQWQRSELFTEPASERLPLIMGLTATFEIRELPTAITSTPDPIQSLMHWAEARGLFVIGLSDFEEVFVPSAQVPALYFDLEKIQLKEQTHSVSWLAAQVKVHLFAPKLKDRRAWLAELMQALATARAVIMTDDSPMRIKNIEYDFAADELQGQMRLAVEYGLPLLPVFTVPINHMQHDWRGLRCIK